MTDLEHQAVLLFRQLTEAQKKSFFKKLTAQPVEESHTTAREGKDTTQPTTPGKHSVDGE